MEFSFCCLCAVTALARSSTRMGGRPYARVHLILIRSQGLISTKGMLIYERSKTSDLRPFTEVIYSGQLIYGRCHF